MKEMFGKLGKHMLLRALSLIVTVVIAVYLTVLIANWGGHMDQNRRNNIEYNVAIAVYANPASQALSTSELQELVQKRAEHEFKSQGLDRPFIVRSFSYLWDAVTLNLGRSEQLTSDSGSRDVRRVLLERLPPTLILLGTAELIIFFLALFVALYLSRRYGSFLDRAVIALAPTSAAPAWLYGLFLIMIFAAVLKVLPWGGMVAAPPPPTKWGYFLSLLRHMVLPVTAMVISSIFASIYSWRTFFLIYSSEDYIELARAKGLSSRALERRYILRPTLPPIITSFMLMVIFMWMGAVVLETVFCWPGIGRLFYQAVQLSDTPVIIGTVVILGYLLAASVLLLDFIYAALDPRVRLGAEGGVQ
ncbi:MAG: ABC transporter permease [Firmicutes bacterium]|nr:ABC transporter permease [Bacillota bacterium]